MNIFVCLGTQDKPFKRLLDLIEQTTIEANIIAQNGYTNFDSKKIKCVRYFSPNEFLAKLKWADVVITHGGVGTIMQALSLNKKIIVMPRLSKYKEHQNDHQIQICENFAAAGYVLYWQEGQSLTTLLNECEKFVPKHFLSNQRNFLTNLKAYIDREG